MAIFAGSCGDPGFANGTLMQARFDHPTDMAVRERDGSIFVADSGNSIIRWTAGHCAPPTDGAHARGGRRVPDKLVPHLPSRARLAADGTARLDAASGRTDGPGRDHGRLLEVPHATL